MGKEFEFAGTVDSDRPYRLKISYCLWPFLRSDQWFLPRFYLELENLGKELYRGVLQVDIANSDNLNSLAEITTYKGPFQDVFHHDITSLKPGKKEKIKFRIESRFLEPGNYILRVTLNEWLPTESPIRELRQQFADSNIPDDRMKVIEEYSITQWQEIGIDPYKNPVGQFKGKQVFDLRFNEIIKVHSLSTVASVMAVFVGGLYTVVKILISHWDNILELLRSLKT